MSVTKNQIVDVINLIMERLNVLEEEQKRQKSFSIGIKRKVIELSDCVDDLIEIFAKDHDVDFSEINEFEQKLQRYSDLKSTILDKIKKSEFEIDLDELFNQKIGES